MEEYRRVAITYDKLLKDIRKHQGFGDLMLPKKFESLTSSSLFTDLHGAVVLINIDKIRCDALILTANGEVKLVKLPDLTLRRAEQMCSLWVHYVGLGSSVSSRADCHEWRLQHLWSCSGSFVDVGGTACSPGSGSRK